VLLPPSHPPAGRHSPTSARDAARGRAPRAGAGAPGRRPALRRGRNASMRVLTYNTTMRRHGRTDSPRRTARVIAPRPRTGRSPGTDFGAGARGRRTRATSSRSSSGCIGVLPRSRAARNIWNAFVESLADRGWCAAAFLPTAPGRLVARPRGALGPDIVGFAPLNFSPPPGSGPRNAGCRWRRSRARVAGAVPPGEDCVLLRRFHASPVPRLTGWRPSGGADASQP